jgi:hypothetical protein
LFGIQLYYTWWYAIAAGIGTSMISFGANADIGYAIVSIATLVFTFYTTPLLQSTVAAFYMGIRSPFVNTKGDVRSGAPKPRDNDPLAWPASTDDDLYYKGTDEEPESPDKQDEDDDPFFR